jgi:hypothetical protein
MARKIAAVPLALLAFWLVIVTPARADHLTYLPLVPNTPLMQSIIQTQTVKWCVNSTGQTYPNFVTQLDDVHAAYARDVGIRFERVAWGSMASTGCQVQHNLTEFSCNGCAAHIFYANWPVVVEYKVSLGYTDWRSAFGHELGHGLLGLHEQYKDSGGTIGCTFRPDTVMSCGSPFVKYPQPRDVNLGCAIIRTTWCGAQVPEPPITYPFWDGDEWVFESGWKYNPSVPSPYYGTPGNWVHTNGTQEFAFVMVVEGGEQWFNYRESAYHMKGSTFWRHAGGSKWDCLSFCFGAP